MNSQLKQRIWYLIAQKKIEIRRRYAMRYMDLEGLSLKTVGDRADEAERSNALGMEHAFDEHDLIEYRILDEAEHRLEEDDFGLCEVCGDPIEVSRLLAIPETSMCLACAAEAEQKGSLRNTGFSEDKSPHP